MATAIDNTVTAIECKYGVKAVNSEAKHLYYLFDEDKRNMGIMVIHTVDDKNISNQIIISKEQAKALINELKDVYNMIFE